MGLSVDLDQNQGLAEARVRVFGGTIKRALDLVFAAGFLVVLAPAAAVVALAVRVVLGPPVLFVQERPGRNGLPFIVRKFRTMSDAHEPDGVPRRDAERLTHFGNFLRSTSLDELPQLISVVTGDMSFIGPRPLLMRYLPYFTDRERLRFKVRPGVTGWAQVNGRNRLGWDDRLALDVWYVEHWSLWLDLRIVVKTVAAVLARRGFEADPEAIMANLDDERKDRAGQ